MAFFWSSTIVQWPNRASSRVLLLEKGISNVNSDCAEHIHRSNPIWFVSMVFMLFLRRERGETNAIAAEAGTPRSGTLSSERSKGNYLASMSKEREGAILIRNLLSAK
jgi:hypothetical protein